jgi:hypothetical protein
MILYEKYMDAMVRLVISFFIFVIVYFGHKQYQNLLVATASILLNRVNVMDKIMMVKQHFWPLEISLLTTLTCNFILIDVIIFDVIYIVTHIVTIFVTMALVYYYQSKIISPYQQLLLVEFPSSDVDRLSQFVTSNKEVIDVSQLKEVVITNDIIEKINKCVICEIDFDVNDDSGNNLVCELLCKHYYHKECITKWINVRNSCPLCNKQCV